MCRRQSSLRLLTTSLIQTQLKPKSLYLADFLKIQIHTCTRKLHKRAHDPVNVPRWQLHRKMKPVVWLAKLDRLVRSRCMQRKGYLHDSVASLGRFEDIFRLKGRLYMYIEAALTHNYND